MSSVTVHLKTKAGACLSSLSVAEFLRVGFHAWESAQIHSTQELIHRGSGSMTFLARGLSEGGPHQHLTLRGPYLPMLGRVYLGPGSSTTRTSTFTVPPPPPGLQQRGPASGTWSRDSRRGGVGTREGRDPAPQTTPPPSAPTGSAPWRDRPPAQEAGPRLGSVRESLAGLPRLWVKERSASDAAHRPCTETPCMSLCVWAKEARAFPPSLERARSFSSRLP